MGCTSQPFCDFHDTAPIVVMPVPDNYLSGGSFGSVMIPLRMNHQDTDLLGDYVAVTAGPGSQVEVIRVALGDEMTLARSPQLTGICDNDAVSDTDSTCYERRSGAGLAYRSTWEDGEQCLVVGMHGHDRDPGIGFWCALGMEHANEAFFLASIGDLPVLTLAYVTEPRERVFIGTERSLQVLEGDRHSIDSVTWESEDDLPADTEDVVVMATIESDEVDAGYLLAIGYPALQRVLIGSVSDATEGSATLTPHACIASDVPRFGGVVELARLRPDGPVMLLTGFAWEDRQDVIDPAVAMYELELSEPPDTVTCESLAPTWTLACDPTLAEVEGVDCTVGESGFGAALDVGNIDDTADLEVIVGCPGCEADGYEKAGAAFVYRPSSPISGTDVLAVLVDSIEDRGNHRLGSGVLIAQVGDRPEPILAAPGVERLLMFLCTGVGDAPPLWDSPYSEGGSLEDRRCRRPER
jgi:hypothetical protein